jgi:hypothetical protein
MSGYTFYINPITITQNTTLVAIPTNNYETTITYDYLLSVNVNGSLGLGVGKSLNDLFTNASYIWRPATNCVELKYDFNTAPVTTALGRNITSITQGTSSFPAGAFAGQEFAAVAETIAMKLKEVMAVKIFGSAGAVSAFTPATYSGFETNLPGLISTALNTALNNPNPDNDILFEQYVSSGRFGEDQKNQAANNQIDYDTFWTPFNFSGSVISIPLFFTGTVKDNSGATIDNTLYPTLSYPPAQLIGGTQIPSNGVYSIPLLLKLHD